jgi:serine/tyrosine/threonine adenylyltransferase
MRLGLQNTYSGPPSRFHARVAPVPVREPRLVVFNLPLAEELGLDPAVVEHEAATWFSGNQTPDDADPIALAYAGHQFGGFVPQLGDGRAILLGASMRRSGPMGCCSKTSSDPTFSSLRSLISRFSLCSCLCPFPAHFRSG